MASVTTEQLTAPFPVYSKTNKGNYYLNAQINNCKSGQKDSKIRDSSEWNENFNGGGRSKKSEKLTSPLRAGEGKWNSVLPASADNGQAEPCAWTQDLSDGNSDDKSRGRNWSDHSIFSGIAFSAEPVFQTTTSDYQWDGSHHQPYIDDEWSGLNSLSDPNLD